MSASGRRPSARRLAATAVVGWLAVLVLVSTATAAPRRTVPFGTFGTVLDPSITGSVSAAELDREMASMASHGVESVRSNLFWTAAEPLPGGYVWGPSDRLVLAAARHHLQLLPIVEYTPPWASSAPRAPDPQHYPPRSERTFTDFMRTLVLRYGPHGVLWHRYPQLRRYAVRDWQIWNEPAGTYDWEPRPWASTYLPLLRAGYAGVHGADPGAKIVLGAMVGLGSPSLLPWTEAASLYRLGARRYFDVMAVNAYTNATDAAQSVAQSVEIVRYVRAVMADHGDAGKPLWVTEFTWPAATGREPKRDLLGIETTAAGQSARLSDYYSDLATHRTGIARAFWYTWATSYSARVTNGLDPTFAFSGLTQWTPHHAFRALPLLRTYARVAARYEGCFKTTLADVCR